MPTVVCIQHLLQNIIEGIVKIGFHKIMREFTIGYTCGYCINHAGRHVVRLARESVSHVNFGSQFISCFIIVVCSHLRDLALVELGMSLNEAQAMVVCDANMCKNNLEHSNGIL